MFSKFQKLKDQEIQSEGKIPAESGNLGKTEAALLAEQEKQRQEDEWFREFQSYGAKASEPEEMPDEDPMEMNAEEAQKIPDEAESETQDLHDVLEEDPEWYSSCSVLRTASQLVLESEENTDE